MDDRRLLVYSSLLSKTLVTGIQIIARSLLTDYDTSSCCSGPLLNGTCQETFSKSYSVCDCLKFVLCGNMKWDGLYLISISEQGYLYEQATAFFPLFPFLSRLLADSVFLPVRWLCNLQLRLTILLSAFILNLILHTATVVALYHMVYLVSHKRKLSLISSVLFCFSPASIFMSVMYTEMLFAFCTFYGLWLLLAGQHWMASALFAFSCATRSNGIVNCGFIVYFGLLSKLRQQMPRETLWNLLTTVGQCLLACLPFVVFQTYGYLVYCVPRNVRPWCRDTIPLIYSFVQKHYWDVGLFRYYQWKQLPNFLLALPIIVLSTIYVTLYMKTVIEKQWLKPDDGLKTAHNNGTRGIYSPTAFPFVAHLAFIVLFGATSMHIQVITRLICSSSPALYWFSAHVIDKEVKEPSCQSVWRSLIAIFFACYCVVGTIMHSTYYPWT